MNTQFLEFYQSLKFVSEEDRALACWERGRKSNEIAPKNQMATDEHKNTMREDIKSWTHEDLRVGLMLQYAHIGRLVEERDALKELLEKAHYALEYASDMTKPDGLGGCDCPICTVIFEIEAMLEVTKP
jgi:hypothetical protein